MRQSSSSGAFVGKLGSQVIYYQNVIFAAFLRNGAFVPTVTEEKRLMGELLRRKGNKVEYSACLQITQSRLDRNRD
jgi:hypothetical protein